MAITAPAEYYRLSEMASMLNISVDAVRMRVKRGLYPPHVVHKRVWGVPKREFWKVCARQESIGLIQVAKMPLEYQMEREAFAGDAVFDEDVLRGKHSI